MATRIFLQSPARHSYIWSGFKLSSQSVLYHASHGPNSFLNRSGHQYSGNSPPKVPSYIINANRSSISKQLMCRSSSLAKPLVKEPTRILPEYTPPTTGLLSYLPRSIVPYAELIRLDKPTGTYYLFFPCVFSTLIAATMAVPMASPLAVVSTTALFFTGALVMRGAGCTINDLWDRNLDPHVERTRLRPIARRAITPEAAIVFTGGQLLVGLGVLLSLPFECFWYATPSLLLVATYPLAKRVTNYPQFVLGLPIFCGPSTFPTGLISRIERPIRRGIQ